MKTVALLTIDLFKIGGTERVVSNLANLYSAEYKVVIFSCYKQNALFYPLDKSVLVECLSMKPIPPSFLGKIVWYVTFVRKMRSLIIKYKVDFLLATTHALNSMLPLIGNNLVKTIGCEHIVFDAVPKIYSFIRRCMYPYLDAIVVLTNSAQKHYKYHSKVSVIPNFISDIPEEISSLQLNNVLAIGRYDYGKSFDRLIRIAALVKKSIKVKIIFRIIGEGDRKEEFEKLIKVLGVEDVVCLIPPTKNIKDEYLNASLYLMTSRNEALPMVLLEAKSYGIPIISFACQEGPVSLVQNAVDGYLIDDDDLESFAERIIYLMTHESKRLAMGEESRKSLYYYQKSLIEQKWKQLFSKLESI